MSAVSEPPEVSILGKNRDALARHHPEALRLLEQADGAGGGAHAAARVQVMQTPSGVPTITVDGLLYHSRYDPGKEAAAAVGREVDQQATAVLILGFGLGYGAEAARKAFPRLPLVILEPDTEVFHAALSYRDLSGLLSGEGVSLYLDGAPDGLPRVLESLPLARPAVVRLRPAFQKNPLSYRAAEEMVQSWLLRKDINTNTLARFGRLWVRNLCRNMRSFADSPGIGSLAGMFDGVPALVVAGGPSLDALVPLLPRLRERLLVVSVNTPLRACLAAGVEPDFTVVVDPQYWASRYLDWTGTQSGCLVAEPSTCPRVFRREDAPLFLCSSLFPLGETLEDLTGARGKLGAGGSVATSAWDLARLLGCRPLYAAGLDLGFPGMRTHCRGVFAEDAWLSSGTRLSPAEGSSWRALRDIGLFPVRSTGGGTTLTDRRMLLYKWWFENQLRMAGAAPSFTLSRDGTAIEGMPFQRAEDLMDLPVRRSFLDERMARVRDLYDRRPPLRSSAASLRAGLVSIESGLGELEDLAEKGRRESLRLAAALTGRGKTDGIVHALDAIDRSILALSARSIAGFLIQGLIHRIEGEGESSAGPQAVAEKSAAIYEGIRESADWQRVLIRRAAEELRRESGESA